MANEAGNKSETLRNVVNVDIRLTVGRYQRLLYQRPCRFVLNNLKTVQLTSPFSARSKRAASPITSTDKLLFIRDNAFSDVNKAADCDGARIAEDVISRTRYEDSRLVLICPT